MPTGIGALIGALIVVYNFLPQIGIHVPTLPTDASAGVAALVAFIAGLFTHPPTTPAKGSLEAVSKAQAEYEKRTGFPIGGSK